MSNRDIRRRVATIRDTLAYLLVYAPKLPAEDQTTFAEQVAGVLREVQLLRNEVQDVKRRHWLDLLAAELVDARGSFDAGDEAGGCSAIQSAEERLDAWLANKRPRPSFIAGPDGDIRKA
jgi:hypothetical protein